MHIVVNVKHFAGWHLIGVDIITWLFLILNQNHLHILLIYMCRYTPISPPDSKGYFDLLIKVRSS